MSGMSIWEILLLGVGLSMDAFAVSICKGLSVKKVKWQHLLCVGAYFGIFQALMPTLGYFLGTTFSNLIDQFDHWVATFTLSPIGLLVGHRFGLRYKSKAELVGGLVLIGIGLKILLEGLGLFG